MDSLISALLSHLKVSQLQLKKVSVYFTFVCVSPAKTAYNNRPSYLKFKTHTITNAILKPEDPTRIGESASEDEN